MAHSQANPELAAQPGVAQLEKYLDEGLKGELATVTAQRDVAYERMSQCHKLRRTLGDLVKLHDLERDLEDPARLRSGAKRVDSGATPATKSAAGPSEPRDALDAAMDEPLRTALKVDLGCFVFATAEVPDARVVHINIGCGVVVPMTHAEAHAFLLKKEALGKQEVQRLSKEMLRVKYRIRLVTETLRQMHERYVANGAGKGRT